MAYVEVDKKVIRPRELKMMNMSPLQILGLGPVATITCGKCGYTWKERVPMVEEPGMACPRCKEVNVLPLGVK